jgi:RND family efflux transporter MFP subunit
MKTILPLLLPLALLAGCAKSVPSAVTAPQRVAVRTAAVEFSAAAVPVRVSGVLARRTEAVLAFKVGGVIGDIVVRAGDQVTRDQVLARLQPDEIEAQVTAARSAVEKARRDFARTEKLQAGAVATLENLQDVRTGLELAEAQLRIAEFNQLHAVIRAPAAGRILRRSAEPNELAEPGRPILAFASDDDGWIVRAGLAERDVARLHPGDRAEIHGVDPAPVIGHVIQIADGADSGTRTTDVEIALDAPPGPARSGFVAAVTLFPGAVPERPVVPASSLVEGDGAAASLYIVEAGAATATRVAVEIEALLGAQAYLRTALPRNARLVIAGGEYLRPGSAVSLTP